MIRECHYNYLVVNTCFVHNFRVCVCPAVEGEDSQLWQPRLLPLTQTPREPLSRATCDPAAQWGKGFLPPGDPLPVFQNEEKPPLATPPTPPKSPPFIPPSLECSSRDLIKDPPSVSWACWRWTPLVFKWDRPRSLKMLPGVRPANI